MIRLLAVMLLLTAPALVAGGKQLGVAWDELGPLILGQDIEFVLPDATEVRAFVTAVRQNSLLLEIQKTSRSRLHPKGSTEISRINVSVIKLRQGGARLPGRILRAAGGYLLGVLVGGYAGLAVTAGSETGAYAGAAVGLIAGPVIGWKTGDPKITTIHIMPAAVPGN